MAKITDKDKGFDALVLELDEFKGMSIKTGVLGEKASQDVGGISLGAVATLIEMGTSRMPARPFMREMADTKRKEIGDIVQTELKLLRSNGRRTARAAAKRIGALQARLLRTTIRNASQWAAPLDESTIRAKGHSRPLVNRGRLVNGIGFAVDRRGQRIAEG